MNEQYKAAVTVAEMSRMVGLSRSRLYQLMGSAFPEPSRDENGRPYYGEEQQKLCLEVRRRNCGVDGKPVLFYAPRGTAPVSTIKLRRARGRKVSDNRHSDILDGVRALGLTTATTQQVAAAVEQSFPSGTDGIAPGEVIRGVFLSVRCQNSTDKLCR
jgi:hypothetical protein